MSEFIFKDKQEKPSAEALVPTLNRAMPFAEEAERGVISGLLNHIKPLSEVRMRLPREAFYSPPVLEIYDTMLEMEDKSVPLDMATLTHALRDKGVLEKCGGGGAVSELYTFMPVKIHFEFYVSTVIDKWLLRRLIGACAEIMVAAYEHGLEDVKQDVQPLLMEAETAVMAITQAAQAAKEAYGNRDFRPHAEVLHNVIDNVHAIMEHQCEILPGHVPTGFTDLDRMTAGLRGGQLITLAARPAMGKTSLAMNIATAVGTAEYHYTDGKAHRVPRRVGVISLEMGAEEVVQREVLGRAGIDLKDMRFGTLKRAEQEAITEQVRFQHGAMLEWLDIPGLSIEELGGRARRLHARKPLSLLVIDYLQLLVSKDRRAQQNRQIEVALISKGLKQLAKELNIPIIVLAQLNRDVEERANGRPQLSDLRESGAIEQDSDMVWLLWREAYYQRQRMQRKKNANLLGDDEEEDDGGIDDTKAVLIFAKHRGGPVGDVELKWYGARTQFVSITTRMFSNNQDERQY